jgi:hypothetical protein
MYPMNRADERVSLTVVNMDRVNSFVHIHQILDVAFMNLSNADRVVRFGVSRAT